MRHSIVRSRQNGIVDDDGIRGPLQRTKSDPFLAMSVVAAASATAAVSVDFPSVAAESARLQRRARLASHSLECIVDVLGTKSIDDESTDATSSSRSSYSEGSSTYATFQPGKSADSAASKPTVAPSNGSGGSAGVKRPSMLQRQRPVARSRKG